MLASHADREQVIGALEITGIVTRLR